MKPLHEILVYVIVVNTVSFLILTTVRRGLTISVEDTVNVNLNIDSSTEETTLNSTTENTLNEDLTCLNKSNTVRFEPRGKFHVLYNYIVAEKTLRCNESVTFTTHGDVTNMDNLEPLLECWQGPVSLALHAPGTDFNLTLEAVRYARACLTPLIKQYVTFHLFFGEGHMPETMPLTFHDDDATVNCTAPAPWEKVTSADLYKSNNNVLYPVNVGRNVARETALTYFVLPSDIKLYPSPGIIKGFLDMVGRGEPQLLSANPKVFLLPVFEVETDMALSGSKTELIKKLQTRPAITSHKDIFLHWYNTHNAMKWMISPESSGIHVFTTEKRIGKFRSWDPVFIGTHSDPLYDERFSWEGKSDKMTQGYEMCCLNYEYLVLDNAFMIHRPGNKTYEIHPEKGMIVQEELSLIYNTVQPEMIVKYGNMEGCKI